MKWLIAALISPLLLLAALSPVLAFVGDTLRVGGPGGAEFHDPCAPGEVVVGIAYSAGKDLNRMSTSCQALHGNNIDAPAHYLNGHGVPIRYGGEHGAIRCPEPMAVQAIYLTESSVKLVHDFWLLCRNLVTGEHYQTAWSRTEGGAGGGAGNANCGDNGYAVGIWGGAYSLVDALGLTCAEYHPQVTTPPVVNNPPPPNNTPPPKPKPKPDRPPLKIDNGEGDQDADNGDGGNDTGGGAATAATDTTIYDQPEGNDLAYLSAGEPVTIVSCNNSNWCRISKPRKGWVWGDDLSR